jgi:hypothetical protein
MMSMHTVNVKGMVLPVAQDGDETYWPIRVISEALRIGWGAQYAKLQPPRYHTRHLDFLVPGKRSPETHVCLPRHEFEFWLKTINARKISPEARQRLTLMRQHFFEDGETVLAVGEGRAQSAAIINRVMDRKLRSRPYTQRAAAKELIEQRFIEEHGCPVRDVTRSELVQAISSMVAILSSLDEKPDVTALSVSARVDAFIDKMISDSEGGKDRNDYASVAALLSAIELEQAQLANRQG